MWQISEAYQEASLVDSKEPVFVAKIENDTETIYLTTDSVVIDDAGSQQLQGVIKSASFNSQAIKPEDGLSSIGGMSISFDDSDRVFTDILNTIDLAGESIYNDKVMFYVGFKNIDFDDYVQLIPLYVKTFTNDELSYTLSCSDVQRISDKSLFADPLTTELVGNYGYDDISSLEVLSPAGYPLVFHGSDWAADPSQRVGYLKAMGISKDGREVKEVISYTGMTSTNFTGVQRGRFGTERIDLSATDSNDNAVTIELIEIVYIDLVQPDMVLALLTGDYGIVGESLPDSWHAGLDASLINSASFADASGTLYQEHIEFRDLDTVDAKEFIAEQCLAPYGTFLRIDQNGQYELANYDYVNQQSAGLRTLTYNDIINIGQVSRNAQGIKNFYQLNWSWRIDQDYYARQDFYIDGNSQTKNKVSSDLETIELRGLRNRDKSSKTTLDFVAQSMIKRKSNAKITRSATVDLDSVLGMEVGELITIQADLEPDYRTLETYAETFEIQSIGFDFLANTASLKLFASDGTPSDFTVKYGSSVASISHSGWTNLDGSSYGANDSGTFKFNDGANIPNGKYYFDGDIELTSSRDITINGSVYVDCANVYLGSNTLIDGVGRANAIDSGYFGGGNSSQGGIRTKDGGFLQSNKVRYLSSESLISNGRNSVDTESVIRVTNNQQIDGLIPSKLYGMAGAEGGYCDITGLGTVSGSESGGAAVKGGAGIFFSCTGFQYESSAVIDLSGSDSNVGGIAYTTQGSGHYFHAGSSGFGWPGVCVVALKEISAPKPFLYDLVVAKTGKFVESARQDFARRTKIRRTTKWYGVSATVGDYYPIANNNISQANKDFATESNKSAIKVVNFVKADDQVNDPAVDEIESASAPIISTTRYMNTPLTQLGDQITYELTATADSQTKYVQFEYRLLPNGVYSPANYVLSTESLIQVTASGDSYEIRATAYNEANKAGGSATIQIDVPLVTRDTGESDAAEPEADEALTLPNIRGLELVNRIDNDENWNQWKSPNAEFSWLKMSNTLAASVSNINGATDLHLEGYRVRITDTDGNVVREETVTDTFYTYTYDKNKKDNHEPIRAFKFEVQAVSTTGYASNFVGFDVSNPAPEAPANVVINPAFTAIEGSFDLPADVDFIGVDIYIIEGTGDPYEAEPKRVSGNTFLIEGLTSGTTHTIGLKSVDQFGAGGQTTAFGVVTTLIPSSALGEITTPVVIDENGGRLITNNGGYVAFHGATDVPTESGNPLIFGAFDGLVYPFWIDSSGDFKFGVGEKYIGFKDGELEVGKDTNLVGVDSFFNSSVYKNYNVNDIPSKFFKATDEILIQNISGQSIDYDSPGAGTTAFSCNQSEVRVVLDNEYDYDGTRFAFDSFNANLSGANLSFDSDMGLKATISFYRDGSSNPWNISPVNINIGMFHMSQYTSDQKGVWLKIKRLDESLNELTISLFHQYSNSTPQESTMTLTDTDLVYGGYATIEIRHNAQSAPELYIDGLLRLTGSSIDIPYGAVLDYPFGMSVIDARDSQITPYYGAGFYMAIRDLAFFNGKELL